MANEKSPATAVVLGTEKGKLVRFSYLNVFKARPHKESGALLYSVQLHIPKENTKDHAAILAAYEGQKAAFLKETGRSCGKEFHHPLVDGDTREDADGKPDLVPGHWILSAKKFAESTDGTENPPPEVVGTERDEKGNLKPLASNQIKSGDFGRASLSFSYFTKKQGGVSVYLNSVQKVRDGAPLGNAQQSATEAFGDYDDSDDILG